ncbi:unnamed protein product [Amoebophrya sp. A25]|nr:unnamed protein product [Amoebophrya sp. A25]|eukprot:GSA25T00004131001.1
MCDLLPALGRSITPLRATPTTRTRTRSIRVASGRTSKRRRRTMTSSGPTRPPSALPSTENWLRQYGRRATFAIDRVLARQERRAKLMNYTPFDNALVGTAGGGGLSTLDDTAGGSSAGSCPPRSVIPGYRGESLRSQIRQQFAKALPREAFPPPERVEYSADGKRCLQASDSASYFATVPSNSDEEKMLKALMRTRFNARGTSWSSGRDRDEAVEGIDLSDPKKFAAFRLHNAKSLQRYERRREQLAKKLAKMGRSGAVGLGAASSSHLSDQEDAGDTTATSPISIWTERPFAMRVIQEHLGKRQGTIPLAKAPVQWEMANEIFALHATSSPKIVEPIAKMGLKISNSEGLFGEGKIFGAADIAKSDQYCTTPGQMPKALFRHLRKLVRMEAFWSQDAKNEYRNQQFCLVFVARMTMGDTRVVNRYAYAEELLQTEFFPGVLKRDSAFHDVLTGRRKDSVSYYSPSFVGHPEGDGALGSKLEKSFAEEQTYITFDEYVLEDARQIYLEYAIFYTRAPLPEVEGEAAARLVEQRKPFHYFSAFETGTYYSEAEKVWNLVLSRGVCHPLQRDEWTGIREGLRQFLRARMPSHLLSKRGQFDRHNVEEWSQMARYASRLKRRFAKRMLATVNRAHFASVLADQVPAGEAWLLGRTENEAMASADAFLRPWELRQRERLRTLQTLIHTKTTVESRRIWDNLDPATRSYCEQIAKLEGMCIFADLLIAKARADPEAGHCVANYLFPPTPTALLVSLLPADAENRMRSIIHQHYKLAKDTTHEDTKLSCIRAQECRDGVLGCGRSFQLHMEVVESTENGDKHLDLSDPLLLSREGKRTEVVVFNPDVLPNLPPLLLFNVPDSDAAQKLTWCHTSMFLRAEAVWKEGRRVWREHGHHGNHYLMEMEIFDRSSSGLSGSQDPPAFDHTSVLKSLPDISTEGRAGLTALDYIARLFSSADRSSTTSGTRTPSATSAEQVEQQLIKHNKRVLSKVGGGNAILSKRKASSSSKFNNFFLPRHCRGFQEFLVEIEVNANGEHREVQQRAVQEPPTNQLV